MKQHLFCPEHPGRPAICGADIPIMKNGSVPCQSCEEVAKEDRCPVCGGDINHNE